MRWNFYICLSINKPEISSPNSVFSVGLGQDQVDSFNPPSNLSTNLYQSQSNPDLMSICYDDLRCTDYPEHVLKVSYHIICNVFMSMDKMFKNIYEYYTYQFY